MSVKAGMSRSEVSTREADECRVEASAHTSLKYSTKAHPDPEEPSLAQLASDGDNGCCCLGAGVRRPHPRHGCDMDGCCDFGLRKRDDGGWLPLPLPECVARRPPPPHCSRWCRSAALSGCRYMHSEQKGCKCCFCKMGHVTSADNGESFVDVDAAVASLPPTSLFRRDWRKYSASILLAPLFARLEMAARECLTKWGSPLQRLCRCWARGPAVVAPSFGGTIIFTKKCIVTN